MYNSSYMTAEDLEIIREVIRDEMKLSVNGKIDRLNAQLEPLLLGLGWIQTTQRFVKWTGIPVLVVIAWFMGFFK